MCSAANSMDAQAQLQHDIFNVGAIGLVNVAFAAAVLQYVSTAAYLSIFLAYIMVDSAYLAIKPESVAFCKGVLCHHAVVTLLLLAAMQREDVGHLSLLMGCVEFDTWVMTVRRAFCRHSRALKLLNLASFATTRFVAHPYCWVLVYRHGDDPLRRPVLVGILFVMLFSMHMASMKMKSRAENK